MEMVWFCHLHRMGRTLPSLEPSLSALPLAVGPGDDAVRRSKPRSRAAKDGDDMVINDESPQPRKGLHTSNGNAITSRSI